MRTPFAYYDPDSSSLKTCETSLFEDLTESSLTLPPSGSMRSGLCYAHPTRAHLTSVPAFSSSPGLLPTPCARDDGKSPEAHLAMKARMPGGPRETITSLSVLARNGMQPELLKTPTAQLAVNGGSQHPDKRRAGGHGPTLADQVEHLLPTPAARDWKSGQSNLIGTNARPLNEVVEMLLPTPRASDGPAGTSHSRSWSTTDRSLHTLVHTGELGEPTSPRSAAGKPSPDGQLPVQLSLDGLESA